MLKSSSYVLWVPPFPLSPQSLTNTLTFHDITKWRQIRFSDGEDNVVLRSRRDAQRASEKDPPFWVQLLISPRIRRVKCDEAKPSCQRCLNTGRKCDGYSSDILISSKETKNTLDLIQRISTHIPGNTEEKRGFHYFLQNTASELSGYYDSSFWESLILAASAQEPSLRHAVIAIGALHEDFSQKRLAYSPSSPDEYGTEFALGQYSKAIGALRRSLSSGKQEPLTALMSCILFVCFDSLRGWFESAMVHLQSGLRILRDMRMRAAKDDHIIEDNIAPLFMRLSIQSIIYVDTRSTPDRKAFARELMAVSSREIIIPEQFESLEEARNGLNQAADGLFRMFYSSYSLNQEGLWTRRSNANPETPNSVRRRFTSRPTVRRNFHTIRKIYRTTFSMESSLREIHGCPKQRLQQQASPRRRTSKNPPYDGKDHGWCTA